MANRIIMLVIAEGIIITHFNNVSYYKTHYRDHYRHDVYDGHYHPPWQNDVWYTVVNDSTV